MNYEIRLKDLGIRIQQARKSQGLSQEKLAEILDISTAYMSDIENGKTNMGIKIFMNITEALQVSSDWLLQTNTPIVKDYQLSEINNLFEDMSSDEIRSYTRLIKEIKLLVSAHS